MSQSPKEDAEKEKERGARPKVRQSRSVDRREVGWRNKSVRVKKKERSANSESQVRPASDGFEYGQLMSDSQCWNTETTNPFGEPRWQDPETGQLHLGKNWGGTEAARSAAEGKPAGGSRSLRQKIQDAVGQCFPIKTYTTPLPQGPPTSSCSSSSISSHRKIHLSELMLDSCPFPADSELAQKWYLIKQHTAPISQPTFLDTLGGATAGSSVQASLMEDEDDRLRERRRISIEQGVEPPPNAQIHTFEVTAQINPLYKLGPKLAHGMNELAGDDRATLQQQQQQQQQQRLLLQQQPQNPLLLQNCLDTADKVIVSPVTSSSHFAASDLEVTTVTADRAMIQEFEHSKSKDRYRVHTQIDYIHCLVPDLLQITNLPCYWGVMDRYEAEILLEGKPEGTFLLRDSAQEDYLFSVSFRRYGRSLHARIEQWNHNFSFDVHDPSVFHASTVTGLLEHYKDPNSCMFFEPLLSSPINRTQPFSLQHICRAVISSLTTYDGIDVLLLPSALKEHLKEYHYKQKVRVRRLDTWWE